VTEKSFTEQAWDRLSDDYQAAHNIPTEYIHYGPHCPTEDDLRLLGDVKEKDVVELGCGGGQCSIAFAKKGARVIGVDISERQLAYARKLASKEKVHVKFIKADIEDLSIIPDGSQDLVFSAYAFQYVKNLKEGFDEVYSILKSGGIFVFSLDHPFYWCFPSNMSGLNVTHSYYDASSREGDLGREYPRTFSQLFNTLFESGFIVATILEPKPVERKGEYDQWPEYGLDRLQVVPATAIFKALKPHGFSELLSKKDRNPVNW
jgi:ubiquinone/menaquinone biosynthesis C-methylase UbiE